MNFYKKIVLILLGVLLLCAPVRAEVVDKIIAVVNDEIITLYEFNAAFEPYRKNIENTYKGTIKRLSLNKQESVFLQRLIDNMLIEQEAKKSGAGITVKDEEVMEALQDMLAKQNLSMQDFLKILPRKVIPLTLLKKR